MKRSALALALLAVAGAAGMAYLRQNPKVEEPKFRTAAIDEGAITQVVLATVTAVEAYGVVLLGPDQTTMMFARGVNHVTSALLKATTTTTTTTTKAKKAAAVAATVVEVVVLDFDFQNKVCLVQTPSII